MSRKFSLITLGIMAGLACVAQTPTFGIRVPIGGEATDLALDEPRGVLYIADFTASRIDRMNRQFTVGLYGNVAPGHSLGEAAAATQEIVNNIGLPPGYRMLFGGQVKILEETTANMLLAFGLASIFMYMVLAAQFESLVHPCSILLTARSIVRSRRSWLSAMPFRFVRAHPRHTSLSVRASIASSRMVTSS